MLGTEVIACPYISSRARGGAAFFFFLSRQPLSYRWPYSFAVTVGRNSKISVQTYARDVREGRKKPYSDALLRLG